MLLFAEVLYAQQDIQGANAPKLAPMEKIEQPKKPDKLPKNQVSVTKVNAPAINVKGQVTDDRIHPAADDKNNPPTLSNQSQINVNPKREDEKKSE
ncbi:MAG: hypothetical protein RML38_01820 [Bacteroidia bacterium]|nr:hypothetical protein [Bacteroidia bacterium]